MKVIGSHSSEQSGSVGELDLLAVLAGRLRGTEIVGELPSSTIYQTIPNARSAALYTH